MYSFSGRSKSRTPKSATSFEEMDGIGNWKPNPLPPSSRQRKAIPLNRWLGELSGIFKSPWASNHRIPRGPWIVRRWLITATSTSHPPPMVTMRVGFKSCSNVYAVNSCSSIWPNPTIVFCLVNSPCRPTGISIEKFWGEKKFQRATVPSKSSGEYPAPCHCG